MPLGEVGNESASLGASPSKKFEVVKGASVEVRQSDMPDVMKMRAQDVIRIAFERNLAESLRAVAGEIKRTFDTEFRQHWHCIIGRSFGSHVSHEPESFFFGYYDSYAVMLFKTVS